MNKQHSILAAVLLLIATLVRAQATVEYIHTDALGSPVAVTNASGAVINRPVTNGPGYTRHVMDAVTGLNYMQQRFYDPGVGRFLGVDTVTAYGGDLRHFNRYDYAFNNPYKFTDPDGRDGELFWTAPDQVTVTFKYAMTGVSPSFTPAQLNAQVLKNYSGTVTVNGVNGTIKAQAVQVSAPGKGVNTINVVKDTAGVPKSGTSETNAVGGNRITLGATGVEAATKETGSHEVGHALGAGDQYKGGVDVNRNTLPADVPGPSTQVPAAPPRQCEIKQAVWCIQQGATEIVDRLAEDSVHDRVWTLSDSLRPESKLVVLEPNGCRAGHSDTLDLVSYESDFTWGGRSWNRLRARLKKDGTCDLEVLIPPSPYDGDPMEWAFSTGLILVRSCLDDACTGPNLAELKPKFEAQFRKKP